MNFNQIIFDWQFYANFNIVKYAYAYISKSKLALSEYNITYLSAIAFIVFMLH